jgi:hypothetical protein
MDGVDKEADGVAKTTTAVAVIWAPALEGLRVGMGWVIKTI